MGQGQIGQQSAPSRGGATGHQQPGMTSQRILRREGLGYRHHLPLRVREGQGRGQAHRDKVLLQGTPIGQRVGALSPADDLFPIPRFPSGRYLAEHP